MTNRLYDALFAPHTGSAAPFLHHPDGTTTSYAAFLAEAARYAHALTGYGLKPGDRVAAHIQKSPQALALYAGCLQAGLVFLPLNTAYTPAEMAYFVEDSAAALLVCDPHSEPAHAQIAQATGARLATLAADGTGSLAEAAAGRPETFATIPRSGDDLAALLYTSGTTGRSKGAMLSHDNLLSNAEALVGCWRFTRSDILLHALPIFHSHGLFVAINVTLLAGGSLIFLPKFEAAAVLAALPRATAMMGVPTFYTRLLDEPGFDRAASGHMRLFISGSAPLLAETHRQFEARTGHRILERYGMTETSMITSNPYDGERRAGTVGFPLPGVTIRVSDPETGTPIPQGEIGVVELRGPNVFQGYWNMPEKTAQEMRQDGFFITGDMGLIDADGYLHIVGRGKDLIISGGYNIYPKEIELMLDEQPGVLESAVIGAPHPDFGESPVAVLVPQPGQTLDTDAIDAAIKPNLAGFKRPRHYAVMEALPRNAMGKVQKAELRAQFNAVFAR